jgi:hypothetical protein
VLLAKSSPRFCFASAAMVAEWDAVSQTAGSGKKKKGLTYSYMGM